MKREQFCHQTIFFHFARKWISFHDKEHLLLHWASFHTRGYSSVIIMAGGFWFWPQSQLSFSNHFWSIFNLLFSVLFPHEYLRLNTFLINCSMHKFQRPLHRRNWAPPNIIAIIPCANAAEISNYLIFLYMSQKFRTSPAWYFDINLNSNEVTKFHVLSNGGNP